MKRLLLFSCLIAAAGAIIIFPVYLQASAKMESNGIDVRECFRKIIPKYLGKPYRLGRAGPRSFDCSGFVWRVLQESGIRIKRSSARKLYLRLPRIPEENNLEFGMVVFFRNFRHCGIIKDNLSFYHASVKVGTTMSDFAPYWRKRICGFRGIPKKL